MRNVRKGDRVSGTIKGQSFTGTVKVVHGRGGRTRLNQDCTWTELEPSTPDAVHVDTDGPLTMPSGRTVHGALLRGPEEIATLVFLDEQPVGAPSA